METIEKSVEVDVPATIAYNQWTQFEDFPQFMEGIKSVRQVDDTHLEWIAEVGGKEKKWSSEIVEQIPDKRIAWRSTSGTRNDGVVTFHHIAQGKSKIMLQIGYEPDGAVETAGDFLGFTTRRVAGDLKRFKEFIESRGRETGAWRGEVRNPDAEGRPS
jgi:Predicted integral membrane protein